MAPVMRSTKAAAVLLASLAVAVAVTTTASGADIKPGDQCECAQTGAAGRCITAVLAMGGGHECTRSADGSGCTAPWECVTAGATHACVAFNVGSTYACTSPADVNGVCPCESEPNTDVSLRPTQPLPGTRGGGGGKATPVPVWKPKGPAPKPQEPACKAKHVGLKVNGKKWTCASPMNINKRSVAAAYAFKDWQQNGWSTLDDFININFLRDAASRLYMCVTYGSPKATSLDAWRFAQSSLVTTGRNRFYVQDDPAAKKQYDTYKTNKYAGGKTKLFTKHHWVDTKTDGFCVDVAGGIAATFRQLELVKGVSVANPGKANPSRYGKTNGWARKLLKGENRTKKLAYDRASRVKPAKVQDQVWAKGPHKGKKRPDARVVVDLMPMCSCDGW